MRSPLTRREGALLVLAGLVLASGSVSALALADEDDPGGAAAAPSPRTTVSATPRATPSPMPSAGAPQPQDAPAIPVTPPPGDQEPPPPVPGPEQRPPEQVAGTFFDAALQGRDADALAVAEAQVLPDLREYEAWDSHRLAGCQLEKDHAVCVFEAASTFLRLLLAPDPATGWRVVSVE